MSISFDEAEWIGPVDAARLLGVSRSCLMLHAQRWGIAVRSFPRQRRPLYQVRRADVLAAAARAEVDLPVPYEKRQAEAKAKAKAKAKAEAGKVKAINEEARH